MEAKTFSAALKNECKKLRVKIFSGGFLYLLLAKKMAI